MSIEVSEHILVIRRIIAEVHSEYETRIPEAEVAQAQLPETVLRVTNVRFRIEAVEIIPQELKVHLDRYRLVRSRIDVGNDEPDHEEVVARNRVRPLYSLLLEEIVPFANGKRGLAGRFREQLVEDCQVLWNHDDEREGELVALLRHKSALADNLKRGGHVIFHAVVEDHGDGFTALSVHEPAICTVEPPLKPFLRLRDGHLTVNAIASLSHHAIPVHLETGSPIERATFVLVE